MKQILFSLQQKQMTSVHNLDHKVTNVFYKDK